MTPRLLPPALLAAGLLAACHNLLAQAERAAVIADPTDESRAELQEVLMDALGDRTIRLAPDALTRDSTLTLEGAMRGDLQRPDPRGRDLGRPVRFDLVLHGGECFLVRRSTQQRWPLQHADCIPVAARAPGTG